MRRIALVLVGAALLALPAVSASHARALGLWSQLAPVPTPRQEISTAALDGRIYVIAGFDANADSTNIVEVYDPANDTWSTAAPLPIATNHNAAAVVGGTLYAFGGTSPQTFAYDRAADAWTEVATMNFMHGNTPAVAVIGGKIYVAGGTGTGMVGNEVEVYDPQADTWTVVAPMNVARNHTAGDAIGGKFYVACGRGEAASPRAFEVYDPQTNTWTILPPVPTGRSGVAAGAVNGKLYVFGGEIPRLFDDVEVYDPATNAWRQLPPMPTPRHGIFASVVGDQIYLPAGATEQGLGATNVNEVFLVGPRVTGASIRGKKLAVAGLNFDDGAVILVNGQRQKTARDKDDPGTLLSKKARKTIQPGQTVTLVVENPDGGRSNEFAFTRP